MTCLFCDIASGKLLVTPLFENEHVMAFNDIHPQAPTHILIIPKQHIQSVHDTQPEHAALLGELLLTAKAIAASAGLAEKGYRLILNTKQDGGQTVDHLHVHLLGGRQMTWPPG